MTVTSPGTDSPGDNLDSSGGDLDVIDIEVAQADAAPRAVAPVVVAAAAVAVAAGVAMRLWSRSPLWLDEAQTVAIAHLPVRDLIHALRTDGSPPLYYLLLHAWMKVAGDGTNAVRLLSAGLSLATLPLAWRLGRLVSGRRGALCTLVLFASSPFAIRYASECRMYSLVVLLVSAALVLALDRQRPPSRARLAGLGAVVAALLYTHYWAGLFVAALAGFLLVETLMRREGARPLLAAVVAGCIPFLAWAPTLLFQVAHTGAPWARPPGTGLVAITLAAFAGGGTDAGNLLEVAFIGLLGAAFFADLRAPDHSRSGRVLVGIGMTTLLLGVALTSWSSQGYAPRHAAVALAPLVVAAALALARLHPPRTAAVVTAAVTVLGLVAAIPAVTDNRTQGADIAKAIAATAQPGDLVVTCPDQLAPAIERVRPVSTFRYPPSPSEPRGRIDWTDYKDHLDAASPLLFASEVDRLAGRHRVLLAWSPNYVRVGAACRTTRNALARLRPQARTLVRLRRSVFENAALEVFRPFTASSAATSTAGGPSAPTASTPTASASTASTPTAGARTAVP